jgi:DNA repair protein RecN (Recombination protein N)
MLLELRAENYAVIDRAEARFGAGLNLLTGETGAGKSILIDALALLLGGKGSAEAVRHGAEKAVVSCVFEATPGALSVLAENGIEPDEDGDTVLLRREMAATGKGRVFVNSQPTTVAVLRALAPELALIHAQGETLGSFDQAQQRLLLDRYGDVGVEAVSSAYKAWRNVDARLTELLGDEQDKLRMAEMWRFQAIEIQQAQIVGTDEDVELEAEKRVLANAEKLVTAAMGAYEVLYEGESSAETTLGQALKLLEELARYEPKFAAAARELAAAKATVEDVSATARDFAANVQAGPERLAEIEGRLALLDRLKRKYGKTLGEVVAFGEDVQRKLDAIDHREEILAELRAEEERLAGAYRAAAAALTVMRTTAAQKLGQAAEQEINDLAMRVQFEVKVVATRERAGWTGQGWDEIGFLIATNAGEPLKPLDEIASGGEMSRVMLALKVAVEGAVTGRAAGGAVLPRTLVFDEIDIGIGGRAAEAVGQKLKALARTQQVICVTHLPQIAAFSDQHFLIEKSAAGGRTKTAIRQMSDEERVQEVARMLSGATVTETSLRHAESMIAASR